MDDGPSTFENLAGSSEKENSFYIYIYLKQDAMEKLYHETQGRVAND